MSDPLKVISDDGHTVILRQPEFADAWEFHLQLHGCLNFGQHEPSDAIEDEVGEGEAHTFREDAAYDHVCDLDLFIAMLEQVRRERDARLAAKPA